VDLTSLAFIYVGTARQCQKSIRFAGKLEGTARNGLVSNSLVDSVHIEA
jgi:hypothetical protein